MGGESLSVEWGTEDSRKSVHCTTPTQMCTIPGSVVVIVAKRTERWPGNRCTDCHNKLPETNSEFLSYTLPLSPDSRIREQSVKYQR